jgi:peptidoglycan hydrolase-like protein with peptidoglycan-binding domain
VLDRLGYQPGPVDGKIDKETRTAIKAFQGVHGFKPTGEMDSETTALLYQRVNRKPVTGWLFARQNFKPVFDAPVDITDPELGLGTHFFAASRSNPAQNQVEWYASTLENHLTAKKAARLGITAQPDLSAPDAAEQAFARIAIGSDIRLRIETTLGSGSSITVTDTGTEAETGNGTDFITVTTKVPANVDGD